MVLGLSSSERVARLARLRIANETPLAIERASLSATVLPDPDTVTSSLYLALQRGGNRPVRAVQRISAANLAEAASTACYPQDRCQAAVNVLIPRRPRGINADRFRVC